MSAPKNPHLSALLVVDKAKAIATMKAAIAAAEGNLAEAARTLSLDVKTLRRHIKAHPSIRPNRKAKP
jgi:DNA-binding NtrC family response regulator